MSRAKFCFSQTQPNRSHCQQDPEGDCRRRTADRYRPGRDDEAPHVEDGRRVVGAWWKKNRHDTELESESPRRKSADLEALRDGAGLDDGGEIQHDPHGVAAAGNGAKRLDVELIPIVAPSEHELTRLRRFARLEDESSARPAVSCASSTRAERAQHGESAGDE